MCTQNWVDDYLDIDHYCMNDYLDIDHSHYKLVIKVGGCSSSEEQM